jgi:branched-chain amino acid aminotransferase
MKECLGQQFICNGELTPVGSFDNSFLTGPDYVYEVFRVIEGVALFLDDHLQRFSQTCTLAGNTCKIDSNDLCRWVYRLISANQLTIGNIKMVMKNAPGKPVDLCIYITEHQYPSDEDFDKGVDVLLFRGMRYNPNAKIMDVSLRNANNLVKSQKNVYETLLVDADGCITEGSRSNVFFVRHGKVITPPLEDVLPGITRKHVMKVCRELSLEVTEEKVLARSLVIMEGLFISGTSRKVLPVKKVDGLDFDPRHPLILQIRDAFDQKIKEFIKNHQSR